MLLCLDDLDEHAEADVDWRQLDGLFGGEDAEDLAPDERADQEQLGSVWTRRHVDPATNAPVRIQPGSDYSQSGFSAFTTHVEVEAPEIEASHDELTHALIENFAYMHAKKLVEWI